MGNNGPNVRETNRKWLTLPARIGARDAEEIGANLATMADPECRTLYSESDLLRIEDELPELQDQVRYARIIHHARGVKPEARHYRRACTCTDAIQADYEPSHGPYPLIIPPMAHVECDAHGQPYSINGMHVTQRIHTPPAALADWDRRYNELAKARKSTPPRDEYEFVPIVLTDYIDELPVHSDPEPRPARGVEWRTPYAATLPPSLRNIHLRYEPTFAGMTGQPLPQPGRLRIFDTYRAQWERECERLGVDVTPYWFIKGRWLFSLDTTPSAVFNRRGLRRQRRPRGQAIPASWSSWEPPRRDRPEYPHGRMDLNGLWRIDRRKVASIFLRITRPQHECATLYFHEGYTIAEVARARNCAVSTVHELIERVREEFRREELPDPKPNSLSPTESGWESGYVLVSARTAYEDEVRRGFKPPRKGADVNPFAPRDKNKIA
ncbi:MAG TPA: hypothetical protein VGN72_07720 [Tepidisphaeraceae bacterium]|jgi:hypothetical protein|nr:hypothetical protein [Tepidisphaeraceae bacterium]